MRKITYATFEDGRSAWLSWSSTPIPTPPRDLGGAPNSE